MEILSRKQAEEKCGPANAVSKSQIVQILKLANLGPRDIFYDLGSGHGRIVRMAVKKAKVKGAIGIEHLEQRFCTSIRLARKELNSKQLEKTDFWCVEMDDYFLNKATVVYCGLEEDNDEVAMYRKIIKKKSVKVVKRYLPLVGHLPVDADRSDRRSWFFLMKTPLSNYKTTNKNRWAKEVINEKDANIGDVRNCFRQQLKRNGIIEKDIKSAVRRLNELIKTRFD